MLFQTEEFESWKVEFGKKLAEKHQESMLELRKEVEVSEDMCQDTGVILPKLTIR